MVLISFQLEKQIEEVRDLFVDIGALVQSQGEMVDNILHNVTRAGIDVEQGKDHLNKAEEYQKSARKKKLILLAVLIVVVLIILLVILIEFGAFSSCTPTDYATPPPVYIYVTQQITTPAPTNPITTSSSTASSSDFQISTEPTLITP